MIGGANDTVVTMGAEGAFDGFEIILTLFLNFPPFAVI